MNEYRSRPLRFPWPPVIYFAVALAAFYAGTERPFPVFPYAGLYPQIAGIGVAAAAIFLDLWATFTLFDRHTTVMPHRSTSHLVTCGPFRYTRNPIYLGYTLLMIGAAFITGNGWFLAGAAFAAIATTYLAIRREEFHLLSRFGFEFERYCRHTRRWI